MSHVKGRYERNGERAAAPLGGYRRSRVADRDSDIRAWIKERADLTRAEISERLRAHGVGIKTTALWHQLDTWGVSFKKNAARQRARARRRESGAGGVASTPARA